MKARPPRYLPWLVSVALLCCAPGVSGQATSVPQERKILTKKDFRGTPDEKENYLARTYTVISIKYAMSGSCADNTKTRLRAETAITVSDKSWMKLNLIRSRELLEELLSHEQGHYDIGEVFAVDLKNRLSNFCFDKTNYKRQADSIFASMSQYYDNLQRKYDRETNYMRDRPSQSKWKRKIADMRARTIRATNSVTAFQSDDQEHAQNDQGDTQGNFRR